MTCQKWKVILLNKFKYKAKNKKFEYKKLNIYVLISGLGCTEMLHY